MTEMETLVFLAIAVLPVLCLIDPLGSQNSVSEIQDLRTLVLKLQQNLEDHRAKSEAQDQKYAVLLHSLLSKLSSTTDDLSAVQKTLAATSEELMKLKIDHNSTVSELARLKSDFATCITSYQNNNTFTESDMSAVLQDIGRVKSDLMLVSANITSMKTELNNTESILKSEILPLKSKINQALSFEASLGTTLSKINETKSDESQVVGLGSDLNRTASKLASLIGEVQVVSFEQKTLKTELQNVKHNLSSVHEKAISTGVVFQASLVANVTDKFDQRKVLHFDNVSINNGNGFDSRTGIFTVPVSGVYFFWANILAKKAHDFNLSIVKNSQIVSRVDDPSTRYSRVMAALYVNKGEQVWFEVDRQDVRYFGSYYSYYGGMLVTAMSNL